MQDKQSLRRLLLAKRDAIHPEVRKVKAGLIRSQILSLKEYLSARRVCIFASFRSEVDTFGIMRETLNQGKELVLPKVSREEKALHLYLVNALDELEPGYWGIREPSAEKHQRVEPASVGLVLVPGAGFDVTGNRIGYGGGYYDRLLGTADESLVIAAPAFEEQIVEALPAEPHDVKVRLIVTDRRIIDCRRGS